jgi:hypothetical protein
LSVVGEDAQGAWWHSLDFDGLVSFDRVALGQRFEVAAACGDQSVITTKRVDGPKKTGEVVRVELLLGEDHPVLLLVAVDPEGAPICRETLHSEGARKWKVHTDGQGRFLLHVDPLDRDEDREFALVRAKTQQRATLEVPRGLTHGMHDLGRLSFLEGDLLVAGIVLGQEGQPLAGAKLFVGARGRMVAPVDQQELGTSHADGTFALRGEPFEPDTPLEVRVGRRGFAALPVPFERGDTGVRIRMLSEGAIEGRVVFPTPSSRSETWLLLHGTVPAKDGSTSAVNESVSPEQNGSFRFGGLVPGEYMVLANSLNVQHGMGPVQGILVSAGETVRDPRLNPLVLEGEHTHRITLHAFGTASLVGRVHYGRAGAGRLDERAEFNDLSSFGMGLGREVPPDDDHVCTVTITGPLPAIDIEVHANGLQIERREDVSGDLHVRLRRGWPVRLALHPPSALPDPPLFVRATLIPPDSKEGGAGLDFGIRPFDETGEALVFASHTGPAKIALTVLRVVDSGATYVMSAVLTRPLVEVSDVAGEQRIDVELTESDIEQMREIWEQMR